MIKHFTSFYLLCLITSKDFAEFIHGQLAFLLCKEQFNDVQQQILQSCSYITRIAICMKKIVYEKAAFHHKSVIKGKYNLFIFH